MRMNEGVEWALHCCVELSRLDDTQVVPAVRLAELYDLPPAYFTKQLRALSRAGVVSSVSGPRGGFRLARPPEKITMLDVVVAIEGATPAFRCTDITRRGHFAAITGKTRRGTADQRIPCAVSQAMRLAELTWRRHLAARTVADLRTVVEGFAPVQGERIKTWLTSPPAVPGGTEKTTPTRAAAAVATGTEHRRNR